LTKPDDSSLRGRGLAQHIVVVASAMVGVCLTVTGLFRLIGELAQVTTLADNVLAADAVVFLGACIAAYLSLRARSPDLARRLEAVADIVFVVGVLVLVGLAGLIALELL
jgi:hypothetical protein